jgi:hypothetical protein
MRVNTNIKAGSGSVLIPTVKAAWTFRSNNDESKDNDQGRHGTGARSARQPAALAGCRTVLECGGKGRRRFGFASHNILETQSGALSSHSKFTREEQQTMKLKTKVRAGEGSQLDPNGGARR